MIKQQILDDLRQTIKDLGYQATDIVCSTSQFGDYSTNVALQLAKHNTKDIKQPASEIANAIVKKLKAKDYLEKVEVAGPGFINFFIKDEILIKNLPLAARIGKVDKPLNLLVEYAHPNTHKAFHIGHLRNLILGESICRILESIGNKIFRANYQGDIGLHVAKVIWAASKSVLISDKANLIDKVDFLSKAYVQGSQAYQQDPDIKNQIDRINMKLYQRDPEIVDLWHKTRNWSLDYFDSIYQRLGVKFDRLFFESEVESKGKAIVEKSINKVFKVDHGAVIFPGEDYGLHNRVFITSAGNPTYEAKEMELAQLEYQSFPFDKAIHVVAHEQAGYFQVVFKALELLDPKFKDKQYHLSYGMVNLKDGKMSSRTGEVVTADWLFNEIGNRVRKIMAQNRLEVDERVVEQVSLGAIKFSMLKFAPGTDISFDIDQSVSLQGDSGPYIQYTNVRIQSLLNLASQDVVLRGYNFNFALEVEEREVLKQLIYFVDTVEQSLELFHPNLITSYLLDLAKLFNLFYEKHRVLHSDRVQFRLALSYATGEVLKKGLQLLGIEAPERM